MTEKTVTDPGRASSVRRPNIDAGEPPAGPSAEIDLEHRVEALLSQMTLAEKAQQKHGIGQMRASENRRLGIPSFQATDGPRGVGEAVWRYLFRHIDKATAFPVPIALASSWNPELGGRLGAAIAAETKAKARNWLLAPCIDVVRDPRAGRTQEGYGEDPHLTARLAVAFVRAVQELGIIACPKHYTCKHQETRDRAFDAHVDERTLRELYLPAFKACIDEADAWSVMTAHNHINGIRCAEHRQLLTEVLKNEWGFDGIVVGDWKDVTDTVKSATAGVDVEMPKEKFYGRALVDAVNDGEMGEEILDESVARILRVKLRAGLFERERSLQPEIVNCEAHRRLALEIAQQSMVLLKNDDNLLPLSASAGDVIALIGPNAAHARLGDEGSSQVRPLRTVSPLAGLRQRLGSQVKVRHAPGSGMDRRLSPRRLQQAVALARDSDTAILCVGLDHTFEGEIIDREGNDLGLPQPQVELIEAVVDANPRTVVVMISGSAIDMRPWSDRAPAIVQAWYPGEQGGLATADVLLGRVNPSGKLPLTFPAGVEQLPTHPGFPEDIRPTYEEGIFVGYRFCEHRGLEPLYPFGHGLSYTTFEYRDLQVAVDGGGREVRIAVELEVGNVGDLAGAEVVQLYVRDRDCSVARPNKELKGFRKVALQAGESCKVRFALGYEDLAYFDVERRDWMAEPGVFDLMVGSSSADIRLQAACEFSDNPQAHRE